MALVVVGVGQQVKSAMLYYPECDLLFSIEQLPLPFTFCHSETTFSIVDIPY